MRKLLQRLWDIAADFANFMGGLGMRLVWLPKLHFSPGAEHVRTDPGPALFVLNHSWWMDAPMLCLLCRRRRISVVAAGEMFTGVRSLAMRSLRCIPVDRAAGADLSFFHEALRRLRAGRCVAIFPEGALNPTETLLPFKQGAALLALQAGVPVIPVYSAGNYQPFQRLQLRFGAPIVLTQRPNAAGVQEATQCLQGQQRRALLEGQERFRNFTAASGKQRSGGSGSSKKERKTMTLERLIRVAQTALEGSEADLDHVTEQTRLQEDLGLNSITMLMLMIGIEDEFSIRFPTERLPELHTVGDVVAVIEELLHAPA